MPIGRTRPGRAVVRASAWVEEVIKYGSLKYLIGPTARLLPRVCSFWVPELVAFVLFVGTVGGLGTYSHIRRVFGMGRVQAALVTRRRFATPLRDYAFLSRIVAGHESLDDRRVVERNVAGVAALREAGTSYILAQGHFSREATLPLYEKTPGRIHTVHILTEDGGDLKRRRGHLQVEIGLESSSFVHGRDITETIVVDKGSSAGRKLLRYLREPGNVVFMHVDAPWADDARAYTRPYTGYAKRVFATGAVHLARVTGCPIVGCVCFMEPDGTMVMDWADPVWIEPDEKAREIDVLNELIDTFERAVGERPAQYVLTIGDERRWNAAKKKWEGGVAGSGAPRVGAAVDLAT